MERWNRVLVCGLGRSGLAAARRLRAEGVEVTAVDEGTPGAETLAALRDMGCAVETGATHPPAGAFDVAVVSPGLDVCRPFALELVRRGMRLVSEVELGWSRFGGRCIAVTGSNGKSSVVKALAGLTGGLPCGNYGLPVCEAVARAPDAAWLVVEVSSFQLETCSAFRPDIGVVLNVLPNHLDRHGSMDVYAGLKARLFARQQPGDIALVPQEWETRFRALSGGRGAWQTFGAETTAAPLPMWRYARGGVTAPGGFRIGIAESYFANDVLGPAAAAIAATAAAAGCAADAIREALIHFEPLPHRSSLVGEIDGVRYVDDSKATNLAALMASVRMQARPVRLIAGGRPKESDFSAATGLLGERARAIYLIGEAAEAMKAAWGGTVPCECCGTLDRAVAAARAAAQPGETVLLAPACTSYDQFRTYGERGDAFQKAVLG